MKIPLWPKKRWSRILILILVVIFVPYLFSRAMSPSRSIAVYSLLEEEVPDRSSKKRLKVACYNIAHGRGLADSNWSGGSTTQRTQRLNEIGKLLKEIDADVVVLNEVDYDCSWSNGQNQAEYLANVAGYRYRVEQRNYDFCVLLWRWRFGNAILSKNPIANAKLLDFESYSVWEATLFGKKCGIQADIQFGKQKFRLLAAHLSHRSEKVRVSSVKLINQRAQESSIPVILAGDLNSTPTDFPLSETDEDQSNAIETLEKANYFQRLPNERPNENTFTFHADEPTRTIDWILIPKRWKFKSYEVLPSKLSDHRPVVAEIEFDNIEK